MDRCAIGLGGLALVALCVGCGGSSDPAAGTVTQPDAAVSDTASPADAALVDQTAVPRSETAGDGLTGDALADGVADVGLPGSVTCLSFDPSKPTLPVIEPQPASSACSEPPTPWYPNGAPAPTLELEIGDVDPATGTFHVWQDGHEAPMHLGMRMGSGVWTVIRVKMPGTTEPKITLQVDTPGLIDCVPKGVTLAPTMSFVPVPGQAGYYWNYSVGLPGACVQLSVGPPDEVAKLCGEWMHLVARVRDTKTDAWGQVLRVVRLYGPTY
jgi:hypothetical protein